MGKTDTNQSLIIKWFLIKSPRYAATQVYKKKYNKLLSVYRKDSRVTMEHFVAEIMRCCLCMYLSFTTGGMQRQYGEAHRGAEVVDYSIIGLPTPQG